MTEHTYYKKDWPGNAFVGILVISGNVVYFTCQIFLACYNEVYLCKGNEQSSNYKKGIFIIKRDSLMAGVAV